MTKYFFILLLLFGFAANTVAATNSMCVHASSDMQATEEQHSHQMHQAHSADNQESCSQCGEHHTECTHCLSCAAHCSAAGLVSIYHPLFSETQASIAYYLSPPDALGTYSRLLRPPRHV